MATRRQLYLSGRQEADRLLTDDPFALLVGMVLDQQIPLEWAFGAPALLNERLGRQATPAVIAEMAPDELSTIFRGPPALHRFPGSMAERVQSLARLLVSDYGGDAKRIWSGVATGTELRGRVEKLPGFGAQKAKIFVALLGKQLGVQPEGWRDASAPFGEEGSTLSVADIDSAESLALVREHKRETKARAKARSGGPTRAKAGSGRSTRART